MSKHKAARHRATPARTQASPAVVRGGGHRAERSRRGTAGPSPLRRTATFTGLAAAATGVVVTGGVLASTVSQAEPGLVADGLTRVSAGRATLTSDELASRSQETVSRSDRRETADPDKVAVFGVVDAPADARTEDMSDADPRDIARALLPEFGFGADQFGCLDSLYMSESGWRVNADNPYSSAYGIPQALPGSKMATAGADWATNPATQIRWGLGYIQERYGTPCGAWSFKSSHGWY